MMSIKNPGVGLVAVACMTLLTIRADAAETEGKTASTPESAPAQLAAPTIQEIESS